jgi:hypothetical protein
MQMRIFAAAVVVVLFSGGAGLAADAPGRYTLAPAGEAFLRLDSATGAMSVCSQKPSGWSCASVADDVRALQQEVDRLTHQTEELRQKLAEAGAPAEADAPAKAPDTTPGLQPANPSSSVPEVAFDQMADLVAKMLRRFEDMVRDIQAGDPPKEI